MAHPDDQHSGTDGRGDESAVNFTCSPTTCLLDRPLPSRVLCGCIAHDLSSPLTYVQWDVDALARLIEMLHTLADQVADGGGFESLCAAHPKLARTYREFPNLMGHIKGGLQRLQQLGSDLALLADDARVRRTIDLRDAITIGLRLVRPHVARRMVVEHERDPSPQHVHGHLADLVHVVMNLAIDAAQASTPGPAQGRLEVRFEQSEDQVVLRCIHNGTSIPAKRVQQAGLVFESVKQIVEDHGGTVCLAADSPTGSDVTIRLPRDHSQIV